MDIKALKSKHQKLYNFWKKESKPCIICAERYGNEKDHLPPKVLLPKTLRNPKTEFFSYPVCTQCNRSSSDQDFLLYTLVTWKVNQESYARKAEPKSHDLIALHRESIRQFTDSPRQQQRRQELIRKFSVKKIIDGAEQCGINFTDINVNQTLTKIAKSIYWLHTEGDILQEHNPGWWIYSNIDTSEHKFIEKHLKTTHSDIYWDDRFIVHYTIGQPTDKMGGVISCSIHFYTERKVGKGISWLVVAAPKKTILNGISLYRLAASHLGEPQIKPLQL